jgi:hypothetical protein
MHDVIKIGNTPTLPNITYARPVDRFIVGLDLGKSIDSTAIAVLHHTVTPLEQFKNDLKRGTSKQLQDERFHVVHLERIALGTSYPAQIAHVKALLAVRLLRTPPPWLWMTAASAVRLAISSKCPDYGPNESRSQPAIKLAKMEIVGTCRRVF